MNRDFINKNEPEKCLLAKDCLVDSPEDFKNSNSESEETTNSENYCRWLDDFGWL